VGAFDTLEHVLQPREVLQKALSALRPGGLLVLTVPNLNALSRAFLGEDGPCSAPPSTSRTSASAPRTPPADVGFESVRFVRRFAGSLPETMNPECTHRPGTRRQRLYRSFTRRVGASVLPWVQDRGWATACCASPAPGRPHPGRARPA